MDFRFIRRAPPVTRALVLAPVVLTVLVRIGLINATSLPFVPSKVAEGEYWRVVTGLFYMYKRLDVLSLLELVFPVYYASEELERVYYPSSRQYLWRVLAVAVAALLLCTFTTAAYPQVILYELLPYVVNHRRRDILRVVLMNFLDVSETAGFIAPLFRGLLLDQNVGACVLAGYLIGHLLLVVEDILPMWRNV